MLDRRVEELTVWQVNAAGVLVRNERLSGAQTLRLSLLFVLGRVHARPPAAPAAAAPPPRKPARMPALGGAAVHGRVIKGATSAATQGEPLRRS